MKPPLTVQVGPFTYEVTSKRRHVDEARRDESTSFSGRCDHSALRIVLDPEQCKAQATLQEVLLHEVLHAVLRLIGYAEQLEEEKLEEQLVNRMAPALLDVLQRNPDLVAFLAA